MWEKLLGLHTLTTHPIAIYNWKNASRIYINDHLEFVKLKFTVENMGNEVAKNIVIKGAFYSIDDTGHNQKSTSIFSLQPGEKQYIDLKLTIPKGFPTILKTQLYMDDVFINEKQSTTQFP